MESNPTFSLQLSSYGEIAYRLEFQEPVELGRQQQGEPTPFSSVSTGDQKRVVIAAREDTQLSRRQVLLKPRGNSLEICNLSSLLSFRVYPNTLVNPGTRVLVESPTYMILDRLTIFLQCSHWKYEPFEHLESDIAPPQGDATISGRSNRMGLSLVEELGSSFDSAQGEILLTWLKSATEVFEYSMLSEKFLEKATEAVIDIAGLDSAQIFSFQGAGWTKLTHTGNPDSDASTKFVLDELVRTRRTTTFHPEPNPQLLNSYEAIVASPILAPDGTIIGALYAGRNRRQKDGLIAPRINRLQASITELLARSVAAGWAWRVRIDELKNS